MDFKKVFLFNFTYNILYYFLDGGVFKMEFNGFTSSDFDFFKKKDKMSRQQYDEYKSKIKLHFRSLCYEAQKLYHKNTGGVLNMNKDFQGFTKKSSNISIQSIDEEKFKFEMGMDLEGIYFKCFSIAKSEEDAKYIYEVINNKKNNIKDFMLTNKHVIIVGEFKDKNTTLEKCRINSFGSNNKNIDSLIESINQSISENKYNMEVYIEINYPKGECIKNGKHFANISYNTIIKLIELRNILLS